MLGDNYKISKSKLGVVFRGYEYGSMSYLEFLFYFYPLNTTTVLQTAKNRGIADEK